MEAILLASGLRVHPKDRRLSCVAERDLRVMCASNALRMNTFLKSHAYLLGENISAKSVVGLTSEYTQAGLGWEPAQITLGEKFLFHRYLNFNIAMCSECQLQI